MEVEVEEMEEDQSESLTCRLDTRPTTNDEARIEKQKDEIFEIGRKSAVASSTGGAPTTSTMAVNDNKAGMQGIDKDRINKIIYEASRGRLISGSV